MNTLHRNPYGGSTPDDLHAAIRRAHVERALAVRQMLRTLGSWLGRIIHREPGAEPGLHTANGR